MDSLWDGNYTGRRFKFCPATISSLVETRDRIRPVRNEPGSYRGLDPRHRAGCRPRLCYIPWIDNDWRLPIPSFVLMEATSG
jgi:hypothetical protein